jgi:hypothetical protein
MSKKYRVTLTEEDRAALGRRIAAGIAPARDVVHARILLKADDGPDGPPWTDADIATALEVSTSTVERVRRRFLKTRVDRDGDEERGQEGGGHGGRVARGEERPSGYWITSVACVSTDGGMVSPSACAVLRLMTSSNVVGCSTGRSAGLAPLRILST